MRLEGSPASLLRDDAQGEGTSTASTSTAIDAFGRAKYIVDSGGPRPLSPTPARSPTLALTPTLTPNLTPTLTPALTLSLSLSTGPSPSQAPRSSSSARAPSPRSRRPCSTRPDPRPPRHTTASGRYSPLHTRCSLWPTVYILQFTYTTNYVYEWLLTWRRVAPTDFLLLRRRAAPRQSSLTSRRCPPYCSRCAARGGAST